VTALLGYFDLDTKNQTDYLQFLQAVYNLKVQSAYINKQSSDTCDFLIKNIVNNFQPVIGETIVSKIQGGQNKSQGGQSTPWLPLRSAYVYNYNPYQLWNY